MDARFFQLSGQGLKGLALYLVGDYGRAARAYRAHFQQVYRAERTASDPAWDALLRGDLPAAVEASRKALEKDPSAVGALLTLADVALENREFAQALGFSRRILARDPEQFDALLLGSVALARSGADGDAIDWLNRALRTERIESRVTSFLRALEATGDLAKRPTDQRPLCLLAHYHRYLRIFDPTHARRAITYAEQAIAAGDRPADAYLTLGVVYDQLGQREKSLQAFLRAIAANPSHAEAYRWAAIEYGKRGDLLNEYRMARAALESAPEDPVIAEAFARVSLRKLGDARQGLDGLRKAVAARPDNAKALGWLGYAYELLGEYERAVEFHRRAIALKPPDPYPYSALAWNLQELGRLDESIAAYRQALAIFPYHAALHAGLAHIYAQQERHPQAIAEYEAAFRLGRGDTEELARLCELYGYTRRHREAVECFREVLRRDPKNIRAIRRLPKVETDLVREGSR